MQTFKPIKMLMAVAICYWWLMLSGCVREDLSSSEDYQGDEKSMLLELNLKSRIVDASGNILTEVAPEEHEQRLHTLRIYAYTNSELVAYHFIPNIEEESALPYGFLVDVIAKSTTLQPVDFYVIANEAGLSGVTFTENMQEDDLNNMTFNSLNGLNDLPNMKMPNIAKMRYWIDMSNESSKLADAVKYPEHKGHTTVARVYNAKEDGSLGDEVTTTDAGGNTGSCGVVTFGLERPTSKLRIYAASLDDESSKLTIVSAKLVGNHAPSSAWVIPHTDEQLKARAYQTIEDVGFDISDAAKTGCAIFDPNEKENQSERLDSENYTEVTARAYYPHEIPFGSDPANWAVPTYYNADGDVVPADTEGAIAKGNILEIQYTFDGGVTTRTGVVYLPPMKRNHYYTIFCLMNNSGRFTIEYTVADWDHITETNDWDLNYEYPSYSPFFPIGFASLNNAIENLGPEMPTPQCWYVADPDNSDNLRYDPQNPFAGCFKTKFVVTAPEDITLTPTINNVNVNVEIWEDSTETTSGYARIMNGADYATTITARQEAYILVVRPKQAAAGQTVDLMVSWVPKWDDTESFLLLVNQGTGDGTLWADSGEETNMLRIKCLSKAPRSE